MTLAAPEDTRAFSSFWQPWRGASGTGAIELFHAKSEATHTKHLDYRPARLGDLQLHHDIKMTTIIVDPTPQNVPSNEQWFTFDD